MQNNLFLRRLLIITDENRCAYDEQFHRGVNIIRGQNSSGKSTIVRFIFYALGGCYSDFVPEALRCKMVVAEVEINSRVITLKRYLEKTDNGQKVNPKNPMYIYYGSIDEYKADQRGKNLKWQKYGYNVSTERYSYSNILFKMMGLPEFKADSNITMHQILRLIYLDQESPLSSIFFFEQFDKEIIRETVSELLMGLYDEQLSQSKLDHLAVQKRIEEVSQAVRITGEFLSDPRTKSSDFIRSEIDKLTNEIAQITDQVRTLREATVVKKVKMMEYQRFQQDISRRRKECDALQHEIQKLKTDIQDSTYFIEALQQKSDALERSISTRDYFDTLHLSFCPECLSPIEDTAEPGHCRLCKTPIDQTKGKTQAIRIKLEMEFQMRESRSIMEENQALLNKKSYQLKIMQQQLRTAQKQYDNAVRDVRSTKDEHIDQLIQEKGFKEGEIIQFRTLLEYAERYERLTHDLSILKEKETRLANYIAAARHKIDKEKESINKAISANGVYMLKNDEDRQTEFMQATDFTVDYKQNQAYISNQHIKLSASSSFYLKMAARFALFFASLQVDSMMYPRLLFSDNMEDKGMEPDRAANFQRLVVRRLSEMPNQNYQLIFATSMIAPELETPEYTIGENYTQENKSLKFDPQKTVS